jgi:hypothetical protein
MVCPSERLTLHLDSDKVRARLSQVLAFVNFSSSAGPGEVCGFQIPLP